MYALPGPILLCRYHTVKSHWFQNQILHQLQFSKGDLSCLHSGGTGSWRPCASLMPLSPHTPTFFWKVAILFNRKRSFLSSMPVQTVLQRRSVRLLGWRVQQQKITLCRTTHSFTVVVGATQVCPHSVWSWKREEIRQVSLSVQLSMFARSIQVEDRSVGSPEHSERWGWRQREHFLVYIVKHTCYLRNEITRGLNRITFHYSNTREQLIVIYSSPALVTTLSEDSRFFVSRSSVHRFTVHRSNPCSLTYGGFIVAYFIPFNRHLFMREY